MTTWTTISSLDAPSGGLFDFPSLTLTGYQVLQVVCAGITVTTDGTDVFMRFYVSGSKVTTGYRWGLISERSTGTGNVADGDTSAGGILLVSNDVNNDVGNDVGEGFSALIMVDNPLSTALYKKATFQAVSTNNSANVVNHSGEGVMENAGAIDGLSIEGSSNLTAGKVRILGMA